MDQNFAELTPPKIPDYYADLQLHVGVSIQEIKRAFRLLAKKHHPDKQQPGACKDAPEFRKIREALECLQDECTRAEYDAQYSQVRQAWAQFYAQQAQQQIEREREAEEAASRKRYAEAELARRKEDERRAARERAAAEKKKVEDNRKAEEARLEEERQLKEARAEERSREAARKAREQYKIAAQERMRRTREMEAERRSQEVAKRRRCEQEAAAEERLKVARADEKQKAMRTDWTMMRAAAELRQTSTARFEPPPSPECDHPDIGWSRRKGNAKCGLCGTLCKKSFFLSPQCETLMCQTCQHARCI